MIGPRFFAEALAEYEDAVVFYATREQGLGARLVRELEETVAVAMELPVAPARVPDVPDSLGRGWLLLERFPIKLIFAVRQETLIVVAVFHARRNPGYWMERVKHLPR